MTMLEKMAQRIADTCLISERGDRMESAREIARAALLAIREPSEGMLRAAFVEMNRTPGRRWKQMKSEAKPEREIFDAKERPRFTAMIDAILADKPEGGA